VEIQNASMNGMIICHGNGVVMMMVRVRSKPVTRVLMTVMTQ